MFLLNFKTRPCIILLRIYNEQYINSTTVKLVLLEQIRIVQNADRRDCPGSFLSQNNFARCFDINFNFLQKRQDCG